MSEPKLRTDNTSGHRGISAFEGKWRARIQIPGGKRFYLGEFESLELAEHAYAEAEKLQLDKSTHRMGVRYTNATMSSAQRTSKYIVKGGEIDIDGELDPPPPSLFPLDGW